MTLEIKFIMYRKDCATDGILLSDLSACMADTVRFANSMQVFYDDEGDFQIRKMMESGEIWIEPESAFLRFCQLLQKNKELYGENLEIQKFIVYNVTNNEIKVYEEGIWMTEGMEEGVCYTPNGIPVTNATVYARLSMDFKGIFIKRKVFVENGVSLRINEDLQ